MPELTDTARVLVVRNPATGESVGELVLNTVQDVDRVVEAASVAQQVWSREPRHVRSALLLKGAREIHAHREELAVLLTSENGKPLDQARAEVDTTVRLYRSFAERMLAWHEDARFLDAQVGLEHDVEITHHEPLGVVVTIVPFNFPSELQAWKVAPALAAGNSVIVKPSSSAPLTVTREIELLVGAGLPEGVLQVVQGDSRIGSALAAHPRVAAVSLTGSTEAGINVATAGAKTLKRVFLELGGNDALIVFADSDLDRVVREAVFGRSLANGQVCAANKRILVQRAVGDEVVGRLIERFGSLRVGDPMQPETEIGPLINRSAADRVVQEVRHSIAQGARLTCGDAVTDGAFVRPVVLVDEKGTADVSRDLEIFGPVLDVIPFDTQEDAIRIANQSVYGLSGAVFSGDFSRAFRVALSLHAGHVTVNGTGLYRSDECAWGGVKLSGNSREGLSTGLEEYMQVKTLTLRNVATM